MNKDALKKNEEAAGLGGRDGEEAKQQWQIKPVDLPVDLPACDSGEPEAVSAGTAWQWGCPIPPHTHPDPSQLALPPLSLLV